MLHKYFDKTFLINLDSRPDRLEKSIERANEIGLEFERVSAQRGTYINGKETEYWNLNAAGLCNTIKDILIRAKEEKLDSILILEDDFEIAIDDINTFVECNIKDVPANWELLYFGANHMRPYTMYKGHVARVKGAYTTHAHAVRSNLFDYLITELSKLEKPIDVIYYDIIQPRCRSYVFRPHVIVQSEDFSDIVNKNINYVNIRR